MDITILKYIKNYAFTLTILPNGKDANFME